DLLTLANVLDLSASMEPIGMPVLERRPGDAGQPPDILIVSSSFGWTMAHFLSRPDVTRLLSVYYYFNTKFDCVDGQRQQGHPIDRDPAALRADILRYRFIVLECNTSQVRNIGFDFPAAVLAAFGRPKHTTLPRVTPAKYRAIMDAMNG